MKSEVFRMHLQVSQFPLTYFGLYTLWKSSSFYLPRPRGETTQAITEVVGPAVEHLSPCYKPFLLEIPIEFRAV